MKSVAVIHNGKEGKYSTEPVDFKDVFNSVLIWISSITVYD